MVNLTVTLTNPKQLPAENWYVSHSPYAEQFCTTEEISNIVTPFRNYITTLPGYQDLQVTNYDVNLIINYTFDTTDNANNAILELYAKSNTQSSIVTDSQMLILKYRQSSNTFYTRTIVIS